MVSPRRSTHSPAGSPIPVELAQLHDGRVAGPVEAGAYFVICEALTNVVKHARATHATVRTTVADGQLLVSVSDDGIGNADAAHGSGLVGLADRVAALDGALEDHEPGGTGHNRQLPHPDRATGRRSVGAGRTSLGRAQARRGLTERRQDGQHAAVLGRLAAETELREDAGHVLLHGGDRHDERLGDSLI